MNSVSLTAQDAQRALKRASSPARARVSQSFFKTGKGQYGEGDIFIGVDVPQSRELARRFRDMSLEELTRLLRSPIHEARLLSLLILADQYRRGQTRERARIFSLYLKNRKWVNNWDLVDQSAPTILGAHLADKSRARLKTLARARSLWDRRIAIVSTLYFIRQDDLNETFALAKILLNDREDLMHKATGWMLREAGKHDIQQLRSFLDRHAHIMPRTMLRYSIEKMGQSERTRYMTMKRK
ncbi:MAG: DNA alkylation repair protein [Bdellovibrionaceae bacterium]|nr:DNA alkylation repair protein [Pseudobdellovibrionaceae bacterium]